MRSTLANIEGLNLIHTLCPDLKARGALLPVRPSALLLADGPLGRLFAVALGALLPLDPPAALMLLVRAALLLCERALLPF